MFTFCGIQISQQLYADDCWITSVLLLCFTILYHLRVCLFARCKNKKTSHLKDETCPLYANNTNTTTLIVLHNNSKCLPSVCKFVQCSKACLSPLNWSTCTTTPSALQHHSSTCDRVTMSESSLRSILATAWASVTLTPYAITSTHWCSTTTMLYFCGYYDLCAP